MFHQMITQQFPKMLNNLTKILDKAAQHAESKKFEMDVLLNARLAPDQFNLIRQIQIATDVVKLSASRLTGKDAPKHEDNEKTLAELTARIQSVVNYVSKFSEKDFAEAAERRISQPRWEGKSLSGAEYFEQWVIPNVYFHITTAYSILRHNGVPIGKTDYLGDMPYRLPQ